RGIPPPRHLVVDAAEGLVEAGLPAAGGHFDEGEGDGLAGVAVPEEVGVGGGGHAQDVHADAGAGAGVAHAVPAFAVLGQEVGDVALVPGVPRCLLELDRAALRRRAVVAGLLVTALQVADDTPAAVV